MTVFNLCFACSHYFGEIAHRVKKVHLLLYLPFPWPLCLPDCVSVCSCYTSYLPTYLLYLLSSLFIYLPLCSPCCLSYIPTYLYIHHPLSALQVPMVLGGMPPTPTTQQAATQCLPCPEATTPTIPMCSTPSTSPPPTARDTPSSRGRHRTPWPRRLAILASSSHPTHSKDTKDTQGLPPPTPSSSSPTDKILHPGFGLQFQCCC